ncbi:MAG: DUF2493 domain-containing protein [Ruminococcaceae bacterium]|nr:DUF2493 domain-containing protein [Oscillospiraceae bacterium]
MKVAVVGSRALCVTNLQKYLPSETSEIVSGGAKGIDICAREYAHQNNIKVTEFYPEYNRYGKAAPLKRNLQIIDYADIVIVFWDGKSKGTKFVIDNAKKQGKSVVIYGVGE